MSPAARALVEFLAEQAAADLERAAVDQPPADDQNPPRDPEQESAAKSA